MKKQSTSKQEDWYEFYSTASADELHHNYKCYLYGYGPESSLIKLVAELRGLDTSDWEEFFR